MEIQRQIERLRKEIYSLEIERREAQKSLQSLKQRNRSKSSFRSINMKNLNNHIQAKETINSLRISSSVIGGAKQMDEFIPSFNLARPSSRDIDKDIKLKMRNKRMLGCLQGTLLKFRQENELFEKSEIAKRRYDAIKETEERLNQASEELFKKEIEEKELKKNIELKKIEEIKFNKEIRLIDLRCYSHIIFQEKYSKFLKTVTKPLIYWKPAAIDDKLREKFNKRCEEFKELKEMIMRKMEDEKAEVEGKFRTKIDKIHFVSEEKLNNSSFDLN